VVVEEHQAAQRQNVLSIECVLEVQRGPLRSARRTRSKALLSTNFEPLAMAHRPPRGPQSSPARGLRHRASEGFVHKGKRKIL
jgi:hypothetical protein